MKKRWFKPVGWIFVPVSVPGTIAVLVALAFCANVFLAIDRRAHSATDTLYGVFPFFTSAFLLLDWIARRTSHEED